MATSKTLTPTNVTIQIPDFTDRPDQRVTNNCIDKEADAINALNGNIANMQNMLGKMLYTGVLNTSSTNVVIGNLSDYNIFCANLRSDYGSGVAFGVRYSATDIRFIGISRAASSSVASEFNLTVSGNTVTSVNAQLGTDAKELMNIRGIV